MRHRRKAKKLGRTASHRKALRKNMALALFEHEKIHTTKEKAKFVQPFVEKLITLSKERTDHNQRLAFSRLQGAQRVRRAVPGAQKEKVERWDRRMVKKLFAKIGPMFANRPGGYTRITQLPTNRLGDCASQVIFELVTKTADFEPEPSEDAAESTDDGASDE